MKKNISVESIVECGPFSDDEAAFLLKWADFCEGLVEGKISPKSEAQSAFVHHMHNGGSPPPFTPASKPLITWRKYIQAKSQMHELDKKQRLEAMRKDLIQKTQRKPPVGKVESLSKYYPIDKGWDDGSGFDASSHLNHQAAFKYQKRQSEERSD